MTATTTPRTDHQVGKYHLIRLIGEGAMGQVYEAVHLELGRRAAVKLLHPSIAKNAELAARFFTEARAASLIEHPGLVHIYEYGSLDDGGAFIAMEYLDGESLRSRQKKCGGQIPMAAVLPLARQMAMSLHAAHAKGVVHRDLKPENIMLVADEEVSAGERVKIFDFGIAKMMSDGTTPQKARTRPGALLGTPSYMAPEQAGSAGGIGPHTDVYALGAMLFDILGGQPPFVADELYQVIGQHIFNAPPLLQTLLPEADPALDALLQRMMAKSPEARPDMRTVASELAKIDGRMRSQVSGPIAATTDRSQAPTIIFRSSSHDRLSARSYREHSGVGSRRLSALLQQWSIRLPISREFIRWAVVLLLLAIISGSLGGIAYRHRHRHVKPPPDPTNTTEAPSDMEPTGPASEETPSSPTGKVLIGSPSLPKPTPKEPLLAKTKPPTVGPVKDGPVALAPLSGQFDRGLRGAKTAYENGHCREAIKMAKDASQRSQEASMLQNAWLIIGAAGCQCGDNESSRAAYQSLSNANADEELKSLETACLRWGYKWNGSRFAR